MRKTLIAAILLMLTAAFVFAPAGVQAASSIVASVHSDAINQSVLVVKLVCTAHTDGAFTDTYPNGKQITHAEIFPQGSSLPVQYQHMGYYLVNAYAVNPGATYPTSGAVTISDETGRQLVGANSYNGVTLTLSTAANGVAFATITDSSKMAVTSKLTVSISDTGSAANVFTLYLVLSR